MMSDDRLYGRSVSDLPIEIKRENEEYRRFRAIHLMVWWIMIMQFFTLLILIGLAFSGSAHADPVCDAPGLPPCAPPPDPATLCAVIAWRTWTPCNWYGVQVPQGTPGSWG